MTVKRRKLTRARRPPARAMDAPLPTSSRSAELLWRTAPAPKRGPKAALTLDRIARAAIDIADADGLSAVSMSRVATTFGFTTMSLYRYVPGRIELIDFMFDTAMGLPPALESVSGGWRPRIERWARELWMLVSEHPWSLEVLGRLRLPGPNELAWMESGTRVLTETGLSAASLLDSLFLIVGQIRIVAQYAVAVPDASGALSTLQWANGVTALLSEHATEFPSLAAATSAGAFAPTNDSLDFGLNRVLDGIAVAATRLAGKKPVVRARGSR
jgi:AcrR family transcriptional regulator